MDVAILSLLEGAIDRTAEKNCFIRSHFNSMLGVADAGKLSADEAEAYLAENTALQEAPVIAICTGEAQEPVEIPFGEILECFPLQIVALVFRRELLAHTGNYNEKLRSLTDFELLCRLTEAAGSCLFVFPGIPEDALSVSEDDLYTYAYLQRRYLRELHRWGKTERLLQSMSRAAELAEPEHAAEILRGYLGKFLDSAEAYFDVAAATAPFVLFRGDDTCHGVLREFADQLAVALRKMGQAAWTLDAGNTQEICDYLCHNPAKALIGFQSSAFQLDFFRKLHVPKFQFWLDNPVFYDKNLFAENRTDCTFLCQDAGYAQYLHDHCGAWNAVQLPPGGRTSSWAEPGNRDRDLVFIGGYRPESQERLEGFDLQFYEYMLAHPTLTFEQGMQELTAGQMVKDGTADIAALLVDRKKVCQRVIDHFKHQVIETILKAGYDLHVYGDSWNAYQSPYAARLVRHLEVMAADAPQEYARAKIGLNIMSWHKAGMTERVADIMLAGAVCLTDETDYLKTHFKDGEEIVCFSLEHIEEIPAKIRWLLDNEAKRKEIARRGYETASKHHTWECRAEEIVRMTENGENTWNNNH